MVDAGRQRAAGRVGDALGAGQQVAGGEHLTVRADDLHDDVVERVGGARDHVDPPRGVVGELERVHRTALGRGDLAVERHGVGGLLDLVLAVQDPTGDRVDHQRVGEGAAALDIDDVGLEDGADGAVGERERPEPGDLLLGEAGDLEPGPAGADHRVEDVAEGDVAADVLRRLQPCLGRSQDGVVGGGRRPGQRRGDVDDAAVGDPDGDHAAERGRHAAEALAEDHGPGVGVGELVAPDQIQARDLCRTDAEQVGVRGEPGPGRRGCIAHRGTEVAGGGEDRGRGAEVVPADRHVTASQQRRRCLLGGGGHRGAALVEVRETGWGVAPGDDLVGRRGRGRTGAGGRQRGQADDEEGGGPGTDGTPPGPGRGTVGHGSLRVQDGAPMRVRALDSSNAVRRPWLRVGRY